jgi:hypothetical protein
MLPRAIGSILYETFTLSNPSIPRHCPRNFEFHKKKKPTDESVGYDGTD